MSTSAASVTGLRSLTCLAYQASPFRGSSRQWNGLARVEWFKTVVFDFNGVESIGQTFSDRIFRVFAIEHPEMALLAINTKSEVRRMLDRARSGNTTLPEIDKAEGSSK
jgi:hypothetical protein